MSPQKDAFTNASQLGEMNRAVWKTLGGSHQPTAQAPPESGDSLPSAQNTTLAGDAEADASDTTPTTE